jgi:ATP-binding cassette, subfamily C (CFTR/MRP), member 1
VTNFQVVCLFTFVPFYAIALTGRQDFPISVIFASLSVLKLVPTPMIVALQSVSNFYQGLASLRRINDYLTSDKAANSGITSKSARISSDDCGDTKSLCDSMPKSLEKAPEPRNSGSVALSTFENASFGVTLNEVILKNITLALHPRTLTLILGEVGSGKSLLLRSIIGELSLMEGQADWPRTSMSFCDQPAWIRSASVRSNIISEYGFDSVWYSKVIWSCNLGPDIASFEDGDQTIIGSSGSTLSGGQKNRIALARAVYARSRFFVADDVLAGLDHSTERKIFKRVFGKDGLLRKSGITALLATHSEKWAREADQIIVMGNLAITETKWNDREDEIVSNSRSSSGEISESSSEKEEGDDEEMHLNGFGKVELQGVTGAAQLNNKTTHNSGEDRASLVYYMRSMGIYYVGFHLFLCLLTAALTQAQCKFYQRHRD